VDRRSPKYALDSARVVASNLRYLKGTWRGIIHDDTIRRASSTLRDLLLNDDYGRAWRTLGFAREPRVTAIDLDSALKPFDLSRVAIALAGGAEFAGLTVAALRMVRVDGLEATPEPTTSPPTKEFGLSTFLKSASLVVTEAEDGPLTEDGSRSIVRTPHRVSRRQIVSYVNHRLGAIHVSHGKGEAEKRLFALLDSVATGFVLGKTGIFWEVLSIGQAIARSPDAQRLIEAVESRMGPLTEPLPSALLPSVLQRLQAYKCPEGTSHDSRVVQDGDAYKLICATCPAEFLFQLGRARPIPVAAFPLRVR
jgi:hypothetical protein